MAANLQGAAEAFVSGNVIRSNLVATVTSCNGHLLQKSSTCDGQVIHCINTLLQWSFTVTLIYRGDHLLWRLSTSSTVVIIHCGRHLLWRSSIAVVSYCGRQPLRPSFTTAMLLASQLLPACFEIEFKFIFLSVVSSSGFHLW